MESFQVLGQCRLVAMPLGRVASTQNGQLALPFRLLSHVSFAQSDETSDVNAFDSLTRIISGLPTTAKEIGFSILDGGGAVLARGKSRRSPASDAWVARLLAYLRDDPSQSMSLTDKANAAFKISALKHDPEFDYVSENRFVNTAALYDNAVKPRTYLAGQSAIEELTRVISSRQNFTGHVPLEHVRTLLAGHLGMADRVTVGTLLNRKVSELETKASLNDAPVIRQIADALNGELRKFYTLHADKSPGAGAYKKDAPPPRPLDTDDWKSLVEQRELNTLIVAALKDSLVAEHLGLVAKWEAALDRSIPDGSYFFQLDRTPAADSSVTVERVRPTAFRIRNGIAAPQPISTKSENHGVAWLNTDSDRRYRVTTVNVDVPAFNTLIQQNLTRTDATLLKYLQGDNKALGESPADLLSENHGSIDRPGGRGLKEPNATGVNFHVPIDDLVRSSPPGSSIDDPYYLEDLWVGYRIDIRDEGQKTPVYKSLNESVFTYSAKARGSNTWKHWFSSQPAAEDYEEREQLIKDRVVDTTLTSWNGIGKSQVKPLQAPSDLPPPDVDAPFSKVRSATENAYPRLLFGRTYTYRMRLVLQGGVSLTQEEASQLTSSLSALYEQTFEFNRAAGFSPGEMVGLESRTKESSRQAADRDMIVLKSRDPNREVLLAPRPLTWDEARFHGVVGISSEEKRKYRDFYVAPDLRSLFRSKGEDVQYFRDPDVSSVEVIVTSLTRNPDAPSRLELHEQHACELRPHGLVGRGIVSFGKHGKWEEYSPIRLRFRTSTDTQSSVKFGNGTVTIIVGIGDALNIYFSPMMVDSASHQTSFKSIVDNLMATIDRGGPTQQTNLSDLTPISIRTGLSGEFGDILRKLGTSPRTPLDLAKISTAVGLLSSAEKSLRVIYPASTPRVRPEIRRISLSRSSKAAETAAYLDAIVAVDSATTETGVWKLNWTERQDNLAQPMPVTVAGSVSSAAPRTILFEQVRPPTQGDITSGRARAEQIFATQRCEETLVFSGESNDVKQAGLPTKFEFPDGRHRVVTATFEAKPRYMSVVDASKMHSAVSEQRVVELENVVLPPEIQLSHIVPTVTRKITTQPNGNAQVEDSFALRLYVHRPWLLTGENERIAIGCTSNDRDDLWHYITRWGEDPFEHKHAYLESTLRQPRASDFGSDDPAAVQYFDDVAVRPVLLGENGKVPAPAQLAFASFAVTYDAPSQLWYADVIVKANFYGWLALALYRHQPCSIEDAAVSSTPVFAYMAKLQNEIVTYYVRDGFVRIAVGPTSDETVSYDVEGVQLLDAAVMSITSGGTEQAGATISKIETHEGWVYRIDVKQDNNAIAVRKLRLRKLQYVVAVIEPPGAAR